MIVYRHGTYGIAILFRLHGSAASKACIPALGSTAVFIAYHYGLGDDWFPLAHPYPATALVVVFTFLLSFKASFSYGRYWEACGAIHQMHSKWLDAGMELAAFHLQSSLFDKLKPPTFASYKPHARDSSIRERERLHELSPAEFEKQVSEMAIGVDATNDAVLSIRTRFQSPNTKQERPSARTKMQSDYDTEGQKQEEFTDEGEKVEVELAVATKTDKIQEPVKSDTSAYTAGVRTATARSINLTGTSFLSREHSIPLPDDNHILSPAQAPAGTRKVKPSLFLQEASHLLSLCGAVAFATLRNDLEQAESPLSVFKPGQAWPPVDPDAADSKIRQLQYFSSTRTTTVITYLLGISRDVTHRTLYNAARPFRVIGGVSDAEIKMLQAARGPLAKVALCTMWLQEFIIREQINGGLGKVAPPIVSRIFQFISDGMIG
eukprot:CAMPEP_0118725822 /NCGR_PEP_ID=MMETSP0800-20121206/33354_1 /TAXON_ID=210618 ORGANISM="Striatella unipunctata, Strain CCMP2910" /NCGR_SAMPLE_ID=MMETSP0800 /ASSEMBLY_ACC=CAM_ASM_000638 /LENGTH=434 /DNA_ID=CAMNT_0006634565 /DNA_START=31 /DNA_END=1335 /DNA_ORIENTATION=+